MRLSLSSMMVVTQVCLSMVLLTGAGLFARSLVNLHNEDVGFDRKNLLLVSIDPRLAGYKPVELTSLYQQLIDRLSTLPQVQSVSLATYSPMSGSNRTSTIKVTGYTPQPGGENVQDLLAGPKYTQTLGVPLLRGRDFEVRDTPTSQPVAIVNSAFAERYFSGQNPIGRSFAFDDDSDDHNDTQIEIVGVLGDIKWHDARAKPEPAVYRPILQIQDPSAFTATIHIRTTGDPTPLTAQVRQMIGQIDDKLPIYEVTTMNDQLSGTLDRDRLIAQLVSFFGALALILACIGLYGVMAHGVARRTNEIGIRMALGARGGNIAWMILREVLYLVLAGLIIGVPVALLGARFIASWLFGMSATDPVTLITAAAVLTLVALLAGYLPARRASRVNPLAALRYE